MKKEEDILLGDAVSLCKKALAKWGVNSQKRLMIEECAELTTAICHEWRDRVKPDEVVSELADIWIMLTQMMLIYGIKNVEKEILCKLDRLRDRLNE